MEGSPFLDSDPRAESPSSEVEAPLPLIERAEPWAHAQAALARARMGSGSIMLVEGQSGLGKTALLSAIGELGVERGMDVPAATGRLAERGFGFGVVMQLFESRVAAALEDGREWMFRRAARMALPLFEAGPRWALSEPSFSLLHGVYRLSANMAEAAPQVLVVDDADLSDEASLRFLLYLAQRIEEVPVIMVVGAGSVSSAATPPLLRELARLPLALRSTLMPLSQSGTAELVREEWLAGALAGDCSTVHDVTSGNPFLVDAIGAELAGDGAIAPGRMAAELRTLGPARIADWALAHAERSHPDAQALLAAVAVLGPRAELRQASALAGLADATALPALDGLVGCGLMRCEDGLLSVSQPVVATAIEACRSPGARAAGQLRAAELLSAEDAPPELVAAHLMNAPRARRRWVVDALCAGAAAALGRGSPPDAVSYLRRALDEPPDRELRAHVVLELGRAEAMAGEPHALGRLSSALVHLGDAAHNAHTPLESGQAFIALGRPTDAMVLFERALAELKAPDGEYAGRLRAAQATAAWLSRGAAGPGGELPPCPERGDSAGDRVLLAVHAMDGVIRGRNSAEVHELAVMALGRGALLDEETADCISYYLAAGALALSEDLATAEAALTAAVEDSHTRGSQLGFAAASHMRSVAILLRGRVVDAAKDARQAIAAESGGWKQGAAGARAVLANCLLETGDEAGAERHLDAIGALGAEHDVPRIALLCARGRLLLSRSDAQGALAEYLKASELAARAGAANPAVAPWRTGAGFAHAALGDPGEGARLAEEELALAESFGAPGPIGRALRTIGMIRGPENGLEALEASAACLESSQAALERARTLVEFGAALRRSGRRRDARAPLRDGLDLAQRCGAQALADRARQEAKVAGARPRRTATTGLAALTPRELQVARLAAEGYSNREIAETLVVTIKTVEWHLKHAFRKLGVESRQKMAGLLAKADR